LYALDVKDACKALRKKENAKDLVVEREHNLTLKIYAQKQPQQIVERSQFQKKRGDIMETST